MFAILPLGGVWLVTRTDGRAHVALEQHRGRRRALVLLLLLGALFDLAGAVGLLLLHVRLDGVGRELESSVEVELNQALLQLERRVFRIACELLGLHGARPAGLARRVIVAATSRKCPEHERHEAHHAEHHAASRDRERRSRARCAEAAASGVSSSSSHPRGGRSLTLLASVGVRPIAALLARHGAYWIHAKRGRATKAVTEAPGLCTAAEASRAATRTNQLERIGFFGDQRVPNRSPETRPPPPTDPRFMRFSPLFAPHRPRRLLGRRPPAAAGARPQQRRHRRARERRSRNGRRSLQRRARVQPALRRRAHEPRASSRWSAATSRAPVSSSSARGASTRTWRNPTTRSAFSKSASAVPIARRCTTTRRCASIPASGRLARTSLGYSSRSAWSRKRSFSTSASSRWRRTTRERSRGLAETLVRLVA